MIKLELDSKYIEELIDVPIIYNSLHLIVFKKLFNDRYAKIFANESITKTNLKSSAKNLMLLNLFNKNFPLNQEELINKFKNVDIDDYQLVTDDYLSIVFYLSKVIDNYPQFIIRAYKASINKIYYIEREHQYHHYLFGNCKITYDNLKHMVSRLEQLKGLEKSSDEIDEIDLVYDLKMDYVLYDSEIQIVNISSVEFISDYLLNNNNYESHSFISPSKMYYRGHAQSHFILTPSINRQNYVVSENIMYEEVLIRNANEFKDIKTHLDILKKMQHYGLPTRLLDISRNLLVALYMAIETNTNSQNHLFDGELIVFHSEDIKFARSDAVSIISSLPTFSLVDNFMLSIEAISKVLMRIEEAKKEATIENVFRYANEAILDNSLSTVDRLIHEVKTEKPGFEARIKAYDLLASHMVIPTQDNPRIIRQDGAFIICSLNRLIFDDLNRLRLNGLGGKRPVFIIKRENKLKITKKLDLYGFNHASLFPEIDQVCDYLKKKNRVEMMRNTPYECGGDIT